MEDEVGEREREGRAGEDINRKGRVPIRILGELKLVKL